jgi:hypothetical protein
MIRPFQLPVHLPRGPEHYWKMMLEFGARGFTLGELAGCTNGVTYATVKTYVNALLRAGAVKIVGAEKPMGGIRIHRYAVARATPTAPVERRSSYTGQRGRIQQQIWTAMRSLPNFSLVELAVAASTDDCPVKLRTAENYVRALVGAGVVLAVSPYARGALKGKPFGSGATAGVYRLTRAGNSGPKPPKIFKSTFVFDPNKNRIVGEARSEEISS